MPALISHWPQSPQQPSPFLLDLNLKVMAALAFPSSPATSTFRQNYNSIINLSYDTDVCQQEENNHQKPSTYLPFPTALHLLLLTLISGRQIESWHHRTLQLGRDLWRSYNPTSCSKQLYQVAEELAQVISEDLQGGRFYILSEQQAWKIYRRYKCNFRA